MMVLKAHIVLYMNHGQILGREDTQKECKMVGAMYVQLVVNSLNERFNEIHIFNASKLLCPKYYPSDEKVCIPMSKQW